MSKRTCYKCKGKHHTSICMGEKLGLEKKSEEKVVIKGEKETTTDSALTAMATKNPVLLQTACVEASNPACEERKAVCRLIMDSGSQRSYITRKLKDEIGLEGCGTEVLSIGTFGGKTSSPKEHDVVKVAVRCNNSATLYMEVVVTEKICSPLVG